MIEKGLFNEVKDLFKFKNLNALNTIGYKEIFEYLEKITSLDKAIEKIKTNSRRYAKRQITWYKSNKEVNWFRDDYDIKNILSIFDKEKISMKGESVLVLGGENNIKSNVKLTKKIKNEYLKKLSAADAAKLISLITEVK